MGTVRGVENNASAASPARLTVGCVAGRGGRINERAIETQWSAALGVYADRVDLPPLRLYKWLGGSPEPLLHNGRLAGELDRLAHGLAEMAESYGLEAMYANMPEMTPYLLLARNAARLPLGFLHLVHSVGSEPWLRRWAALAPLLNDKDVLLCSTTACRKALRRISPAYDRAVLLPLCLAATGRDGGRTAAAGATGAPADMPPDVPADARPGPTAPDRDEPPAPPELLSIGRIEDVKNIDRLLDVYDGLSRRFPELRLTIAGEYTGPGVHQREQYRTLLDRRLHSLGSRAAGVRFVGAIEGEAKDAAFRRASVLVNLSTDPGETFGYNLLEAKRWGVPVVCTNWNGFRDVVSDGVDGLLVDVGWEGGAPVVDADMAVEQCARLLEDATLRRAMGREAGRCLARFAAESVMPRVVARLAAAAEAEYPEEADRSAAAMETPIRQLGGLYRDRGLATSLYGNETPLSLLRPSTPVPLADWYRTVKPLIGFFAGKRGRSDDG